MSDPELGTQPQEPTTHEKLGWCLGSLGQRITTVGVSRSDASVVRGWAEGDIPEIAAPKVSLLYDAARTVSDVYDDETARAFLRSASPYLGDNSPLEVIAGIGTDEAERVEIRERVMIAASVILE